LNLVSATTRHQDQAIAVKPHHQALAGKKTINETFDGLDIVWRSNGPKLHKLRKLVVREIMSNKGLDACYEFRRLEIRQMVKNIHSML
ncbi:hypothetical protein Gogos_001125, partial [Gossypium gossypioides]|nr:hypothetical protein [Gossypium gossypioides]